MVQNTNGLLKPGLFAKGILETGYQTSGLIIPEKAILNKNEQIKTIFIYHKQHIYKKQLPLKLIKNTYILEKKDLIAYDLKAGDYIVNYPEKSFINGMAIDAIK